MDKFSIVLSVLIVEIGILLLISSGISIGLKSGRDEIINNIKLISINEDYENEVILSIDGDLYENDNWGNFNKYFSAKEDK